MAGRSARKGLQALPAAQQEITTLAEQFNGDFLQEYLANETFFKNNALNYGVIHLAMHGVLNHRAPMLSSLVFTEDKDSIEDNFLQAFEISHLHLKTRLVIQLITVMQASQFSSYTLPMVMSIL